MKLIMNELRGHLAVKTYVILKNINTIVTCICHYKFAIEKAAQNSVYLSDENLCI